MRRLGAINLNLFPPSVSPDIVASFWAPAVTAAVVSQQTAILADQRAQLRCEKVGALSWRAAAQYLVAYKMEQAQRKGSLYRLAHNLSRDIQHGPQGFLDAKRGSVYDGMFKTLEKNLSRANQAGLQEFRFVNGLSGASCRGSHPLDKPPSWLSEIQVIPLTFYSKTEATGGFGCNISIQFVFKEKSEYATSGYDNSLYSLVQSNGGLWAPSVGVEKNPWCMAYVGVKAETQPRIPFSPFGPVTLKARAFAKPFGGRIGPWFHSRWSRNSSFSSGSPNMRTDPLLPPRRIQGETPPSDPRDLVDIQRFIPNYSRYPRDRHGLMSLFFLEHALKEDFMDISPNSNKRTWKDWKHIFTGSQKDFLQINPERRRLEMAVIAPDLFDAHYYSIQPDFFRAYWHGGEGLQALLKEDLGYNGFLGWGPLLPDLGSFPDPPQLPL